MYDSGKSNPPELRALKLKLTIISCCHRFKQRRSIFKLSTSETFGFSPSSKLSICQISLLKLRNSNLSNFQFQASDTLCGPVHILHRARHMLPRLQTFRPEIPFKPSSSSIPKHSHYRAFILKDFRVVTKLPNPAWCIQAFNESSS